MTANDCVIDPDQTGKRANGKDDWQRCKSGGDKRQTNHVRLAGAPIAVEQRPGAFPIQIARPMHTRTRVENNILNQLRHRLVAENLHCALVHWQALSRFARADEGGCMLRRPVWLPNRSLVTPIINWKCYRILRLLLESRTRPSCCRSQSCYWPSASVR